MGHGLATVATTLAGYALTWMVQSSVLLALGLILGRLLKRSGPALESGVYRTTLAAVLVCPIASAFLAEAGFDGLMLRFPSPASVEQASQSAKAFVPQLVTSPVMTDRSHETIAATPEPVMTPPAEFRFASPAAPVASVTPERSPRTMSRSEMLAAVASLLLGLWLLGSAFLGLRLVVGQWRMGRVRASAFPAGPEALALCREVAQSLQLHTPEVLRSPFLFSPCLDGLRRPAILLPEDVIDNLRETFVHELAHLARHDGVWNLLRRTATVVLWVQLLIWVLSRRLEATAEEVCDDYVVHFGADRTRYADHLVELAGRALPPVAPAVVGMVSLRTMLARRIVRILDTSRCLSTQAGAPAVVTMFTLGLTGTLLAGLIGVGGGKREALAETKNPATTKPVQAPAAQGSPADVPITGQIVDLEGRSVAGVVVKVGSVDRPKSGDLTPWIEAVKNGEPPWFAYNHTAGSVKVPDNVPRESTTDKDGRFRFEGLGAEHVVGLSIRGESVAYTSIDVVTRKTDPFAARGFPDTYGPGSQTIYGADFTYTARPSRPIEGVVRDAKTKQPVAGVNVESWRFAGSDFVSIRQLKTVTDESGRFRIVGMPKANGNVLIAIPDNNQPYFMREAGVDDPPGIAPVAVEIELHRGIMITGKITDKVTGKPIADARLHYLPFLENAFVQALPEFDSNGNVNGFQTRYTTTADGTYRLVGMPGHAIVGVESVGKTPYRSGVGSETIKGMDKNGFYKTWRNPIWPGRAWPNTLVEINPPDGTQTLTLEAQLDRGLTLRIKVVDGEGKPVPDADVTGGNRMRSGTSTPDAVFELSSFRPDESRNVVIRHDGLKLGKVVRVRAGDDANGPVVVTLAPYAAIKARIVDADGNPVSGATLRVDLETTEAFGQTFTEVACDREGRFEVLNVPVGCEYGLVAEAGTMIKEHRVAFGRASVKAGETTDVGDIKFKHD